MSPSGQTHSKTGHTKYFYSGGTTKVGSSPFLSWWFIYFMFFFVVNFFFDKDKMIVLGGLTPPPPLGGSINQNKNCPSSLKALINLKISPPKT